jgi:hypothetical protein
MEDDLEMIEDDQKCIENIHLNNTNKPFHIITPLPPTVV